MSPQEGALTCLADNGHGVRQEGWVSGEDEAANASVARQDGGSWRAVIADRQQSLSDGEDQVSDRELFSYCY